MKESFSIDLKFGQGEQNNYLLFADCSSAWEPTMPRLRPLAQEDQLASWKDQNGDWGQMGWRAKASS